jgi:hypothetical protein
VKWEYLNAQEQRKIVWPASFAKPRAFLDQLERDSGLAAAKISAARSELDGAEKLSGQLRQQALKKLASRLESDVPGAADQPKVQMLVDAVIELANVRPDAMSTSASR